MWHLLHTAVYAFATSAVAHAPAARTEQHAARRPGREPDVRSLPRAAVTGA